MPVQVIEKKEGTVIHAVYCMLSQYIKLTRMPTGKTAGIFVLDLSSNSIT